MAQRAEVQRVTQQVAATADEMTALFRRQNVAATEARRVAQQAAAPPGSPSAGRRRQGQSAASKSEAQRQAQRAEAQRVTQQVAATADEMTALFRRQNAAATAGAPATLTGAAAATHGGHKALATLKRQLLEQLVSLDRGAAATREQGDAVDATVRQLEALGGPVELAWTTTGERRPPAARRPPAPGAQCRIVARDGLLLPGLYSPGRSPRLGSQAAPARRRCLFSPAAGGSCTAAASAAAAWAAGAPGRPRHWCPSSSAR